MLFRGEGRATGGAKAAENVGFPLDLEGETETEGFALDGELTLGVNVNGIGMFVLSAGGADLSWGFKDETFEGGG